MTEPVSRGGRATCRPRAAGRSTPSSSALTFRWSDLPTVTPDLPGCGGRLRADPDDFVVRELPLYLPSAVGATPTPGREGRLDHPRPAAALIEAGVAGRQIGVAGLKDKVARTEQWLSVPRRHEAEAWAALEAMDGVRVLETSRHVNKLGIGHLRGNAFRIRVRGAAPTPPARRARSPRASPRSACPTTSVRSASGASATTPSTAGARARRARARRPAAEALLHERAAVAGVQPAGWRSACATGSTGA
jgi:hypothetical protein